ncbi:MAG: ATP-binding cassette domain-containing protein, partial [Clostridia bacterium]|nr:ATP-binding cassette domain-containing protein [Clostridia bacterium]
GHINFADYSAFLVSINLFLNPINTLIRFMEMFQNGAAGVERFVEIMDIPPESDNGTVEVDRFEGKIEFDNVSCSYDGSREVLKGVNISIDKGDTFAFVGPSGGGKTTMCHLIPHFYDIASGAIRIDGHDIRDIKLSSLRRNIGIVQQDIYLFNASVRDNILYGRLDATEEEVIEAAKRANIHDYIMSMENGYDTVIGERGVRLSGGQKQRLCIARVFLKNPPILILDEATSALDNATERLIQQSLDELCVGRTTLVVAHRLSTIKNANRIAVVSEGEIIEQGSHRELIEKGGAYAQLHSKQFRENEQE